MENRLMVQEGHLLAIFNSAHRVMKAESMLKSRGLPILLIPAPRQLQTDCGLAIRFHKDNRSDVMAVLKLEKLLPEFISRFEAGSFVTIWNLADHAEHEP
jgi:hypothetical protein